MYCIFVLRQCVVGQERTLDWAFETPSGNPQPDRVTLHVVVADTVILGGFLADKLAEIGSIVATADSIALELTSLQKAEW